MTNGKKIEREERFESDEEGVLRFSSYEVVDKMTTDDIESVFEESLDEEEMVRLQEFYSQEDFIRIFKSKLSNISTWYEDVQAVIESMLEDIK